MSKTAALSLATALAVTITLDTPLTRGEQTIDSIQLRKPKAGELRGCSLSDLAQLDVAALGRLLPRISEPTLTTADVDNLDPADLMKLGAEVVGFLLPASARASLTA
jgi:hypothetical protein